MRLTRFHHAAFAAPAAAFTLVEVVLVLVLIGILTSMAVPRYGKFIARQQLEAAARRVEVDLQFAQRSAKLTSASQGVVFNVTNNYYTLTGMADPDHATGLYRVSLGVDPYRAKLLSADFGGLAKVIFNGYGVPDNGGTVTIQVGAMQKAIQVGSGSGLIQSGVLVMAPL